MQSFRLLELSLISVEFGQVVQVDRGIRMIRSQLLLADREDALVQRFRLLILPLVSIESCPSDEGLQQYQGALSRLSVH